MKTLNLSTTLKAYKSGWVAVNKSRQTVVATAPTFTAICTKIKGKKNILLVPAAKNYFGFVTVTNG